MTNVPLRDLGMHGVNTDAPPLTLPPTTFSMAVNARFENQTISRSPAFRMAGPLTLSTQPRLMCTFEQLNSTGVPQLYISNDNGTVTAWQYGGPGSPSTETAEQIAGYVPTSTWQQAHTYTNINGVMYLNRPDRVPWYVGNAGGQMNPFTNTGTTGNCGWDPSWRCQSLRSSQGVLVALNVTKAGVNYPTMIKTSDYMTFGSLPDTWVGSASNSATENILTQLWEPLIDGCNLRNFMVLYSNHTTWLMSSTGDNSVFRYDQIFSDVGVINQNCVVEHQNRHYVFGYDDIWYHDGFSKNSLAAKRVRSFIYKYMVRNQSWQFFVFHNPFLSEIAFCYVSNDPYCAFSTQYNNTGCNRAAVYNYNFDTWYFYDLPYITSASIGLASSTQTWAADTKTWSQSTTTWYSMANSNTLCTLTCGQPSSTGIPLQAAVRSFEDVNASFTNGPIDTNANQPLFIENLYIDLDNVVQEIRGYKVVTSIYPQGNFDYGAQPVNFYIGATDYSNSPAPVFTGPMTFDGNINYKLDFMAAGRFLSFRATYNDYKQLSINGVDVEIEITGHR